MKNIPQSFRAIVRHIDYVGHRYAVLKAQCSPDFIHSPGQYTKVSFVDSEGSFDRYYSIASAPRGDGSFELCLILDEQRTRQLLATWHEGSSFLCSAPSGRFTVPLRQRPIVCIAGGSGITPLKAIIEDRLAHGSTAPTLLLYGCQNDSEIPFYEALKDLERQHAAFKLRIFADENTRGRAEAGRPLDALHRFILPEADYLLCGPPAFMEAARQLLVQQGIAPEAIHQDRN